MYSLTKSNDSEILCRMVHFKKNMYRNSLEFICLYFSNTYARGVCSVWEHSVHSVTITTVCHECIHL